MLKLNLGCGNRIVPGYLRVDINPMYADVVHDLRVTPYPFEDNSADDIDAHHVVEHLYAHENLAFMNECWRILCPGGKLEIVFPHCDGPYAWADPTHVRAVHPDQYTYFTRENYMGYTERVWKILISTYQSYLPHKDFHILVMTPEK